MKINVILITYNHAEYIHQALDGIIKQDIAGDVEIIVADDSSTDNTIELIEAYESKLPSNFSFRFLLKENNLGFVKNYKRAFSACDGDYILIVEGDDYWTSPKHISNHVSFLENHPECSMSYNRHIRYWVDQERFEIFDWNENSDYVEITIPRLIHENCIGNFTCCAFRGKLIKQVKPSLFDMYIADWMLGIVMAEHGNLAYQKEVTSIYRIHDNGQWSRMSGLEQSLKVIEMIEQYDKFLDYKYTEYFTKHKRRLEICIYGDKSMKGRLKKVTPDFLRSMYRKIFT